MKKQINDFAMYWMSIPEAKGEKMPRYNVEAGGEWACYTSISDRFITPFMPREKYEAWRKKEYGILCKPLERANNMSLKEAIYDLSLNKSDSEIIDCLKEAGLIYSEETEEEYD